MASLDPGLFEEIIALPAAALSNKMFDIPSSGAKSCKITLEYAKRQLEKNNLSGALA